MSSHRNGFVQRAAVLLTLLVASLGAGAEGFDRSYKLYAGDIDSDGRTDIYVNWQPQLTIIAVDSPNYASIPPTHPGIDRIKADLLAAHVTGETVSLYLVDSNCNVGKTMLGGW